MDEFDRALVRTIASVWFGWVGVGLLLGFAAGAWECLAACLILLVVLVVGSLAYALLGKVLD